MCGVCTYITRLENSSSLFLIISLVDVSVSFQRQTTSQASQTFKISSGSIAHVTWGGYIYLPLNELLTWSLINSNAASLSL